MKKHNIKSLFLLILLFGITLSIINPTNAQVTNVKVGLLTPQTGALSVYTRGFEQAAELAITDLNADPTLDYTFELTVYDTKTEPTSAAAAMTQAVTDGMHYVVGAAGSSNTLSAATVAVSSKVPLISYASTSPDLSLFDDHAVNGDEGYLWRIPPSDALQGQVIADLADAAGYTSMVIVTLDNAYGAGLAASTKAEFAILGGITTIITYSGTTVDFSTIVTQIVSEAADIVVAISYATDGSLLFVEMANQDLRVPVIGADGVADAGIFGETTGTQESMQGFLTIKPIAVTNDESAAFANAYAAAFTDTTGDIYTGETYDAVWAGALAIASQGSTLGEDIIRGLRSVNWAGASGPISFDLNGDSTAGLYQISEVRSDQMERIGTWDGINGLIYEDIDFYKRWSQLISTIKVGLLTPQTGGLSAYTRGFERAAELAIADLNADSTIDYTFELTVYDTKTEPTGASAAMTQAVTDGVSYVVGAAGSSNTLAAAAVAVVNKVPLISYASTSPHLSSFNDHAVSVDEGYLWRIPPSDALQGQVIANVAIAAGYSSMVIVTIDNAYGAGLADSTKAEFAALGGTVIIIHYPGNIYDFSTIVTQIASEAADIVVAISYASDGSQLFVEMANQNLRLPVIGADGVSDAGIFGETIGTQESMQGFLTSRPIGVVSDEGIAFEIAYNAAFVDTTGDIYTGETYDAVFAGALAINASGSVAGEEIIAALAGLSWNGVTGPLTFDDNGDSNAGFYEILEVTGGTMEAVGSWDRIDGLTFTSPTFITDWKTRNALEKKLPLTVPPPTTTTSVIIVSENQSLSSSDDDKTSPELVISFSTFGLFTAIILVNLIARVVRRK